jgi:hypothetical protein
MAREDAAFAAGERRQPRRPVPGGRQHAAPVGRHGEPDDLPIVGLDDARRRRLARDPDRDATILARAQEAPVGTGRDRVDGPVVEADDLDRLVADQVPHDRGLIEAARHGSDAVAQHRQRSHRPAMTAQLRPRRRCGEQGQGENRGEEGRRSAH